jgi:murein DD-endopeptidase MepM/ murein hydrolase activator NlpD
MLRSSGFEIFRDKRNLYERVRPRRRYVVLAVAAAAAVVFGNLWWYNAKLSQPAREQELADWNKNSVIQSQQLERLGHSAQDIAQRLESLKDMDAQLRDMIRLDKDAKRATTVGEAKQAGRQEADAELNRMEAVEAYQRALARPVRLATQGREVLTRLPGQDGMLLGAVPDAWPVEGIISSGFGLRLSPFANQEEFHKGVDITAPAGSKVLAPAPGKVTFTGQDTDGSLSMVLDHQGGYMTSYSHLQSLSVAAGQDVQRGDEIGKVGANGHSTGPHLHYEVRLFGLPVDPKRYLP